ncbi:TonB-dependent receptor, partial [candidate division KSB1 bacterium]
MFIIWQNGAAQTSGSLIGSVVDEDNLPLPGANILISDANTGAATDQNGEFRLSPLSAGDHVVEIMFIGFQTVRDTVSIRAGHSTTLNVVMASGIVQLDAVVVFGERLRGQAKALNQQKTNFNITNVVSADQVGRFPDQNIGDALKRIAAISVNYNQGEARYANIRGVGPSLNAVTIDGESAASADAETRAVQLDLIPAEMVQSIEINKTTTPDMDADAIGGSINLVTRQAPNVRRVSATLGSGYNVLTGKPMLNGGFVLAQRFFQQKVGLVLSGALDDRRLGSHNTEGIWAFDANGRIYPKQWDVRLYDIRRLRRSLSVAGDYRLNDNNRFFLNIMLNHRDDWENRVRLRYRLEPPTKKGVAKNSEIRRQTKGGPDSNRNKKARLEDQRLSNFQIKGKHNISDLFQAEWSVSIGRASEIRPRERYFSWHVKDAPVQVDLASLRTPLFTDDTTPNDFTPEDISEEFRNTHD